MVTPMPEMEPMPCHRHRERKTAPPRLLSQSITYNGAMTVIRRVYACPLCGWVTCTEERQIGGHQGEKGTPGA